MNGRDTRFHVPFVKNYSSLFYFNEKVSPDFLCTVGFYHVTRSQIPYLVLYLLDDMIKKKREDFESFDLIRSKQKFFSFVIVYDAIIG